MDYVQCWTQHRGRRVLWVSEPWRTRLLQALRFDNVGAFCELSAVVARQLADADATGGHRRASPAPAALETKLAVFEACAGASIGPGSYSPLVVHALACDALRCFECILSSATLCSSWAWPPGRSCVDIAGCDGGQLLLWTLLSRSPRALQILLHFTHGSASLRTSLAAVCSTATRPTPFHVLAAICDAHTLLAFCDALATHAYMPCDVTAVNAVGITPLHIVCSDGMSVPDVVGASIATVFVSKAITGVDQATIARVLLACGGDPCSCCVPSSSHNTPLHTLLVRQQDASSMLTRGSSDRDRKLRRLMLDASCDWIRRFAASRSPGTDIAPVCACGGRDAPILALHRRRHALIARKRGLNEALSLRSGI